MANLVSNLGQVVGQVEELLESCRASHEDVDLFGAPSECHRLVAEGNRRDVVAFFERLGVTATEFIAEVESRTSHRWVYFRGLDELLSLTETLGG